MIPQPCRGVVRFKTTCYPRPDALSVPNQQSVSTLVVNHKSVPEVGVPKDGILRVGLGFEV